MKAMVYHRYGGPDVLALAEVPQPTVGERDVLVRIHAASVNALDWRGLRADPFFIRLMGHGVFRPTNPILGADIAGVVEAVGAQVQRFRPGDAVFGDIGQGGFAEYAAAPEDRLVRKPDQVTFEQAAAVPVAALTALQGLRDVGQLQPDQHVLINGASGGVGTFAVQLARLFGAEVTGVCSPSKMELVRAQGAHHVIDYTREDFAARAHAYDLVLDLALMRSVASARQAVRPGGTYAVAGGHGARLLQAMALKPWRSGVNVAIVMAETKPDDLGYLADLLADGRLTPALDRRFTLGTVPDAIRHVEKGQARGKVVVRLVES